MIDMNKKQINTGDIVTYTQWDGDEKGDWVDVTNPLDKCLFKVLEIKGFQALITGVTSTGAPFRTKWVFDDELVKYA